MALTGRGGMVFVLEGAQRACGLGALTEDEAAAVAVMEAARAGEQKLHAEMAPRVGLAGADAIVSVAAVDARILSRDALSSGSWRVLLGRAERRRANRRCGQLFYPCLSALAIGGCRRHGWPQSAADRERCARKKVRMWRTANAMRSVGSFQG
jgi:hypothetical protein